MNPIEIAALQEIVISSIVAGTFLVTAVLVLRAWTKRATVLRERDATLLLEGMDTLSHSIEELRHDVSDINDRFEFSERLLAQVAESTQAVERRPPGEP